MKNLPVHKLLYPALAAAALLSAASVGLYSASYNSYVQCRCSQTNEPGTNFSWDACCADTTWGPANKTNCCTNSTAFKNVAANGCTSSSGKVYLSSVQVMAPQPSSSTLQYSPDGSVCNNSASYCPGTDGVSFYGNFITSAKSGKKMCASTNYSNGVTACTIGDSAFPCYFDTSFNANYSYVQTTQPVGTCIIPNNSLYGNCQSQAFHCEGGCTSSGTLRTCYDNMRNVTFNQNQPYAPVNCYAFQCLCSVSATYVECK